MRREDPADRRAVENLTREAFWGMTGPRCNEHLLVRRLRESDAFVPELDMVAEVDGTLVGSIVFSRAQVVGEGGRWDVLTFGPLSVAPGRQGSGVGGALLRRSLVEAARLGHRAVLVYGHPDYYPRFGFVRGSEVGITAPGGITFDALMALELVDGGLNGVRGEFRLAPAFVIDPVDAEAFDATFPAKELATLTPIDVFDGHLPASVLVALGAHEIGDLQALRRFSFGEMTAWDGIGAAGGDALRAVMAAHGLPWGPPREAVST
ncbi:GNAT family N-acetyltransferase [Pengzhenrongella frigida]|uniref:N-acetyltransferase n=1 Tax=Pengzhenrongella frigida TaxID=1259133 RepID=A0A4Q5MV17_9MICO|nr:N-acetyltransferase [Cellulomonas sp. HLT2-17]RYV49416.1 N-acetyltransferase [Cellulomonas sp. HLT2-17]